MAKQGDYTFNNIYQGGYSTLDPNKAYSNNFTGYRTDPAKLGVTTNPQTANVIGDVSSKLSSGLKQIELTLINPKMIELVSDQQLQEIKRLSDLTGVGTTIHGPVIDTVGINQQGYDELNRKHSEDIIIKTLEKSYLVNPKGNTNVTFHTTEGIPGSEWKTLGGPGKEREANRLIAVDRESGRSTLLKPEVKYYPGGKVEGKPRKVEYSAEENLESANQSQWDDKITQLFFNKERADEILQQNALPIQHLLQDINEGKINPRTDLQGTQKEVWMKFQDAHNYLQEVNRTANSLFAKAWEYGTEEQKQMLIGINEGYKKELNESKGDIIKQSQAMHQLLSDLQNPAIAPEMFVSMEKFATEKSAQTFGNAAFAAYKKFKDNTPIISIENPPIGHALATGEDLRNVIESSRKVFIDRMIKENHVSEKEARQIAEKLIGATWDVGHINILRKQGFGKEEIIKETEKIKPYLKHVHLSDNFGLDHTELPMGMGNVPFKEIMDKLGKEGFEAKKIIEAGDWWQQQMNPIMESLEGLGTPIYANGKTPYWNQSLGFYQGYQSGLEGAWLPGNNYQTFGTYFSQLPTELGGSVQSSGSRMSGRGME